MLNEAQSQVIQNRELQFLVDVSHLLLGYVFSEVKSKQRLKVRPLSILVFLGLIELIPLLLGVLNPLPLSFVV